MPIDPNDRDELNRLVARSLPWIQGQVRRRLGAYLRVKVESSDIVQDSMVRFLNYCPKLPPVDEDGFRALMSRIVENSIRDTHGWLKAACRDPEREVSGEALDFITEQSPEPSPSQAFAQKEEIEFTRFCLSLLNPIDRYILVARNEGVPFREIAEALEMSEDAVTSRRRRAEVKLLGLIKKLEKGDWRSIDWKQVDDE